MPSSYLSLYPLLFSSLLLYISIIFLFSSTSSYSPSFLSLAHAQNINDNIVSIEITGDGSFHEIPVSSVPSPSSGPSSSFNNAPPGIILPVIDASASIVPVWMLEAERKLQQEQKEREEEAARKKQAEEKQKQREHEEQLRQQEEEIRINNEKMKQSEAEERASEVEELLKSKSEQQTEQQAEQQAEEQQSKEAEVYLDDDSSSSSLTPEQLEEFIVKQLEEEATRKRKEREENTERIKKQREDVIRQQEQQQEEKKRRADIQKNKEEIKRKEQEAHILNQQKHQQQQEEQTQQNNHNNHQENNHNHQNDQHQQQQQEQQQHHHQEEQQSIPSEPQDNSSPSSSDDSPSPSDDSSTSADEALIEAERLRQAESDRLSAEAARQYASQIMSEDASNSKEIKSFNPADSVYQALQASNIWEELTPHNAWNYVTRNKPFLIIMLCRCDSDDDWNINEIDKLLSSSTNQLYERFSFLYTVPETAARFSLYKVFGVAEYSPYIVIDNIPIGQHAEKYVLPHKLSRPAEFTPILFINWLNDFLAAPSPLTLVQRTTNRGPALPYVHEVGKLIEITGNTYEEIVLKSDYNVLILLYSPSCPGCHTAFPIFEALAQSLAFFPNLLIAKMDRTENDTPNIVKFDHYPAIFLYISGDKTMDTTANQGEEPNNRGKVGSRGYKNPIDYYSADNNPRSTDSCSAPINEQQVRNFVEKYLNTQRNKLGFMGMGSDGQSSREDDHNNNAAEQVENSYETTIHTEAAAQTGGTKE